MLSGKTPLTVDQFSIWSQALDLQDDDIQELVALQQSTESVPVSQSGQSRQAPEDGLPAFDPLGIQAEEAVKLAFALGVDFAILSDVSQLKDSGVPEEVLKQWEGRGFLLRLDAAYHRFNEPNYTSAGLSLTLSFDALYTCSFPWSSIQQVMFFVEPPPPLTEEPEPESRPLGSHLRLVT